MKISLKLKRPFIWLSRFRHRRGYGVHSPFAFDYITHVIYEKGAYYKYAELLKSEVQLRSVNHPEWTRRESIKLKRLLFRMVNRAQPHYIIDVGPSTSATLYLQAAKARVIYTIVPVADKLSLADISSVDFLYLHQYQQPSQVRHAFELCVNHVTPTSVFVIQGICYTAAMKQLWDELRCDSRVGITFDLYDIGILFFDHSKNKQDYIVNF